MKDKVTRLRRIKEVGKASDQQQKAEGGYSIANEELNEDLILHCWRLVQGQVRRVIEFNRSQGVPNPDAYVGYNYADGTPEPMSIKQKIRWLNIIRHKKSGKAITVDSLVASGRISDIEREMFGQQKYPRIELSALTRVKTQDNSEYLMRSMRAIGAISQEKSLISPTTAKLQGGMDVKILEVGTGEFTYETSPKIYTTPFNKENVLAAIEKYPPSEDNDTRGKITYALKREGTTNEVGISNLEEFIEGNFNELWARQTTPNPQININSKDLATFLKLDRESRESHEQYQ